MKETLSEFLGILSVPSQLGEALLDLTWSPWMLVFILRRQYARDSESWLGGGVGGRPHQTRFETQPGHFLALGFGQIMSPPIASIFWSVNEDDTKTHLTGLPRALSVMVHTKRWSCAL